MPQPELALETLMSNGYAKTLDPQARALLVESAPLIEAWSQTECRPKPKGGMEEWAKENKLEPESCGWYHGTWQYLRLLDMVAVPHWHRDFYNERLGSILRQNPHANVLISAAADWGMLASLHEAIQIAGASPDIVLYDICKTPLKACQWYADLHNLPLKTRCANIITENIPEAPFDLIVTDEFLSVLKAEYKPLIAKRWMELLKPGGSVVTVAMMGDVTTPELREGYAQRASQLLAGTNGDYLPNHGEDKKAQVLELCTNFAEFHTRHMLSGEEELRSLLSGFDQVELHRITTLGECVNPTDSFQIVASKLRE
ncbi:MAG TPA: class I SAM-dependent methyltransferase [Candidatus Angelobacter sp.]